MRLSLWTFGAFLMTAQLPSLRVNAADDSTSPKAKMAAVPVAQGRASQMDGGAVAWEYHYNRNSLLDTLPVPGGFLSLTSAGNLLLLDEELKGLRQEYFGSVRVTCLGRDGKGLPVAGMDDGRIMAIDLSTLVLSPIATVAGSVRWLGYHKDGWVVVHAPTNRPAEGMSWREAVVTDLVKKRTYELPNVLPSTFLLDRKGRLWIGEDRGEWGGSTHWLDFSTGKLSKVPMPGSLSDNVYGFVELADGLVMAFGGTLHMSLASSYITRVDVAPAQVLFASDSWSRKKAKTDPADKSKPRFPISQMVQGEDRSLLVFSFSEVFRTDCAFKAWRPFTTLNLRYFSGRPDAVGTYPAIHQIRQLGAQRLLLVTGGNGNVLFADGQGDEFNFSDQFGLRSQATVLDSPVGPLMLTDDDREQPWQWEAGRWVPFDGAPTFRLSPLDAFARALEKPDSEKPRWRKLRFASSPQAIIHVFTSVAWSSGTRGVDRWDGMGFTPIATAKTSYSVQDYFFTPSGDIWAKDDEGQYARLDKGRWVAIAKPVAAATPALEVDEFLWDLRLLSSGKAPWLYFHPRKNSLLRFQPGVGKLSPVMARVPLGWKGKKIDVLDAIPDGDGAILLATELGLFRFDPLTRKVTVSTQVPEGEPIHSLAWDGRGRLWLAGKDLRYVPGGQARAKLVEGLPLSDSSTMKLLGKSNAWPNGVVIGLGDRGVMVVKTAE